MLSVRLDGDTERLLRRTIRALGRSRSEIVKASLREFCARTLNEQQARPYALIQDLLGHAGSGRGDLSIRSRKHLLAERRYRLIPASL